jgi:hypothetical protein
MNILDYHDQQLSVHINTNVKPTRFDQLKAEGAVNP